MLCLGWNFRDSISRLHLHKVPSYAPATAVFPLILPRRRYCCGSYFFVVISRKFSFVLSFHVVKPFFFLYFCAFGGVGLYSFIVPYAGYLLCCWSDKPVYRRNWIRINTVLWRESTNTSVLQKVFFTRLGLLQCYVLSNIFLLQTFKVFPLYWNTFL